MDESTDVLDLTAEIVANFVANNKVGADEIPSLVASVHKALTDAATGKPETAAPADEKSTPAQIRKSVQPDSLISFIDGRRYKTLGRHLTSNGMTPDSYRSRFGLPRDYPMVSSNYSAHRSEMAKRIGLGRSRPRPADEAAAEPAPAPAEPKAAPARRGRKAAANNAE